MRIRPMSLVAVGVVAVAFDPRVVAWDAFPDVLGWALVAYGAWQVSLRWPAGLAVAAAVASTAEAQLPYRYDDLDPLTGEVLPNADPTLMYHERLAFEDVVGPRLVLLVVAALVGGAVLCLLLRGLADRAEGLRDEGSGRRLRLLSVLVPVAWSAPYVVVALVQGVGDDGFDPIWNGALEVVGLAGFFTMLAVAYLLATTSNRRWSASGVEHGSPWGDLMVPDSLG